MPDTSQRPENVARRWAKMHCNPLGAAILADDQVAEADATRLDAITQAAGETAPVWTFTITLATEKQQEWLEGIAELIAAHQSPAVIHHVAAAAADVAGRLTEIHTLGLVEGRRMDDLVRALAFYLPGKVATTGWGSGYGAQRLMSSDALHKTAEKLESEHSLRDKHSAVHQLIRERTRIRRPLRCAHQTLDELVADFATAEDGHHYLRALRWILKRDEGDEDEQKLRRVFAHLVFEGGWDVSEETLKLARSLIEG